MHITCIPLEGYFKRIHLSAYVPINEFSHRFIWSIYKKKRKLSDRKDAGVTTGRTKKINRTVTHTRWIDSVNRGPTSAPIVSELGDLPVQRDRVTIRGVRAVVANTCDANAACNTLVSVLLLTWWSQPAQHWQWGQARALTRAGLR